MGACRRCSIAHPGRTGRDGPPAALLTLLGVSREAVMEDYLRSNDYVLPRYARTIQAFVAAGGDRELLAPLLEVRAEYLELAFTEMERQYGSIERYFGEALGIDEGDAGGASATSSRLGHATCSTSTTRPFTPPTGSSTMAQFSSMAVGSSLSDRAMRSSGQDAAQTHRRERPDDCAGLHRPSDQRRLRIGLHRRPVVDLVCRRENCHGSA